MEKVTIGKIKSLLKSIKRAIHQANNAGRFDRVQELKAKKKLLVARMEQLNRAAYHGAAVRASNTKHNGA